MRGRRRKRRIGEKCQGMLIRWFILSKWERRSKAVRTVSVVSENQSATK